MFTVMTILKTFLLFSVTALFEILGCYLPWLVLKSNKPYWLLIPGVISLGLFSFLLTLHPTASGRTYAAYGGVYIFVALLWLYFVDKAAITKYDILGAGISLIGMFIIMLQPKIL